MQSMLAIPRGSAGPFAPALASDKSSGSGYVNTVPSCSITPPANMLNNQISDAGCHIGLRLAVGNMSGATKIARVKVILVYRIAIPQSQDADNPTYYYVLKEYGTITATAGTQITSTGNFNAASHSMALAAHGQNIEAMTGKDSQADDEVNGFGSYWIPDINNCYGVVFDIDLANPSTPSTKANVFSAFTT